jgi:ABC-type sugar transport system permease subunit
MIRKHITVAMMLGLIFIVKEFGLILVTTAGGPGTRSYTLPYAVYMQVFNASNVGRAGALATITVICDAACSQSSVSIHSKTQRHV